jgi:NADH dehydrogenase
VSAHRVVILGGGFGGLHAARILRGANAEITLIDRRNYHLFQPLLYQVATGSLSPGDISSPLRLVLRKQKNTRVLMGEAADIDPHARSVTLLDGARFDYDSLIVATGSETSYFHHDSWCEWAPSLKTVEEAIAIRHKILFAFEAAERTQDPAERHMWLTFVIVGGGATGVELAGALGEIARHTLRSDFRSIRPEESRIFIVDNAPRILQTYPEELSAKAEKALIRLGVRVRSNLRVTAVDENGVVVQGSAGPAEKITSRTVLWAGGVKTGAFGRVLAERTGSPLDNSGRIPVNPDLTLPGFPEIYVVGDLAAAKREDGSPMPGVAQVAMQGGEFVAHSINARLRGDSPPAVFRYHDRGDLAVIGRGSAVARIKQWKLAGFPAWLVWLFVHLWYLVDFQDRVLVFIQWGFQYLTFSRGALLITGSAVTDSLSPGGTLKNLAGKNTAEG